MKSVVAQVRNVKAFAVAGQALIDRSVHTPGIGVVYGRAGDGKSRTVSWWATRTQACYVRAMAAWRSPGPMLEAIALELGIRPRGKHSDTIKLIAETMARSAKPRPLAIDEADYLVKHEVLLNSVRDIHDLSGAPTVLIGMEHFVGQLVSLREQEQFVSRISQVVKFEPLDRDDAAVLLKSIGDVAVEPALVDWLHRQADGSARRLVVAMEQIENYCRSRGLKSVGLAEVEKLKFSLDRRPEILDRLGLRVPERVSP